MSGGKWWEHVTAIDHSVFGEKEFESRQKVIADGVSVNEKTYEEMKMIAEYTGAKEYLPAT